MPSTRRQLFTASHQGSGHPDAITVAQTPLRSVQRSIPPFYGQIPRSAAVSLTTFVTSPRAAAEISLPTLRRSISQSFPWQLLSFPRVQRTKCRCQRRGDPFRGCFHRKTDRSVRLYVDGPRSKFATESKGFQLYALNSMLDLPATATRADVEKAIEGKIVARGAFTGKVKGS